MFASASDHGLSRQSVVFHHKISCSFRVATVGRCSEAKCGKEKREAKRPDTSATGSGTIMIILTLENSFVFLDATGYESDLLISFEGSNLTLWTTHLASVFSSSARGEEI